MGAEKKETSKKEVNIEEELAFWASYQYEKDADSKLFERFKKIKNAMLVNKEAQIVFDNMKRILPKEEQPVFFLKVCLELPKKECEFSRVIREGVKKLCEDIFSENHFDVNRFNCIGKEIWCSSNPEIIITAFIKDVKERLNNKGYSKENILALEYIWLVSSCKSYHLDGSWKIIKVIEKVFVELFVTKKETEIKNCVEKAVPKAIVSTACEKQFLQISYLYADDEIKLKEFEERIKNLENETNRLLLKIKGQQEENKLLKNEILELKDSLETSKNEREELKKELSLKANMLEYKENEFEHKFVSKQENLLSEVKNLIGNEIENIETIAERIPEKDGERLKKCIQRMWKQIAKLGGEE